MTTLIARTTAFGSWDDFSNNTNYIQVSVGQNHVCSLLDSGFVACDGDSASDQTLAPDNSFRDISSGADFTCGINDSNSIQCWGDDTHNQVTPP